MHRDPGTSGVVQLVWDTGLNGVVTYKAFRIEESGQYSLLSFMDQGPFDTALEVAQWAWRVISKEVPPSSC